MTDVILWDDLDPMGAEMDDPLAEALQDFYHRLLEPIGSNPDDPDRGVGLVDRLSGLVDPSLATDIDAEAKKDDRFDGADTIVTDMGGGVFQIDIQLQPAGSLTLQANAKTNTVARVA